MRHTVFKAFWTWNFEKEEEWINSMSAKGMQLVGVGFCKYIFEEGAVGEYTYRIELLNQMPMHPESVAYIHFLEDAGIEHIGTYVRWVYLRRKSSADAFDLFSDNDSRIKHLKRVLTLLLCLLPLEIGALGTNIGSATMGSTLNMFMVCLLSVLLVLFSIGSFKLWMKIRKLKKERIIYE